MDITTSLNTNTTLDKQDIANKIKNISLNTVEREMNELIKIGTNASTMSSRCRTGNNVVDYFKRFMIYLDFQCIHRSFWLLRLSHLQCARCGSYERSSNFGKKIGTLENYYSTNVSK